MMESRLNFNPLMMIPFVEASRKNRQLQRVSNRIKTEASKALKTPKSPKETTAKTSSLLKVAQGLSASDKEKLLKLLETSSK